MSTDTDGWITDDNGTELFVGQRAIWCRACEVWWPCNCDERVVDDHATIEVVGADARPVDGPDAESEPELRADGSGEYDTHLHRADGLWIPPELRTFERQVVIRTPQKTVQHFGNDPLDPYYGMITASDFGEVEDLRDPRNADLAPNRVTIKPEGEEPVTLTVDFEPELRADGGAGPDGSEQDQLKRYGPVLLSTTDADGGSRLYISQEAIEESGLDPDGAVILQPYANGIHVIDANDAVFGDGGQQRDAVAEWEANNESFDYDPPDKDPELWSSGEYTELYDRVINRRETWRCQNCHREFGTLEKARRHVEHKHSDQLLRQARSRIDDSKLRADGGTVQSSDGTDRPDPEDDPFACSICGCPLGSLKRLSGEEYCDSCLDNAGFGPEGGVADGE